MDKDYNSSNLKYSHFKLTQIEPIKNIGVYNMFINWVIGEFDLYLKNESEQLKIYYPNGWFKIRKINENEDGIHIEIMVEGKSKTGCNKIMDQVQTIYNHVISFQKYRN